MDITNTTATPISFALPRGKKLFLGPGKTGQISPDALSHPPVVELLESGAVKVASAGATSKPKRRGVGKGGSYGGPGQRGTGARRQSGDR